MSPRQLAVHVGVSGKTVERWISDEDLVPHARNREDASQALGVDAAMLWPKAVRSSFKTGTDREIIRSYPYRSACPSSVWGDLIREARSEVYLSGYTNYFLWLEQPNLVETLRRKAAAGVRVRFLLGDPDAEVTRGREAVENMALTVSTRIRITLEHLRRLGAADGLEARYSAPEDAANHVSLSVFRFDDEALVTPHLARLGGHDSPLLHLRRTGPDGMFSRFAAHAEELWERGAPVPASSASLS